MFTESILISLLYVTPTLVHCAPIYNVGESNEEFLRKCCLRDIDLIDDRQNRCDPGTLNHTSIAMLYRSFGNTSYTFCCSVCSENAFELRVDSKETSTEQQRKNSEEEESCFKRCISDDQTIRIWKKEKKNNEDDKEEQNKASNCDSVFKSLNFWGANMVVFANIVYIVPYTIVVTVYLTVLRKSTRAYHRAVICYNATQIVLNGIIIGMGSFILCHVSIHSNVYTILGLTLMFLTISSTSWLFVICIDMTLVITRFRWTSSNSSSQQEEKGKFVTYAGWTWGSSLLVTAVAGVADLSPLLPISSPVRPNFNRFDNGPNFAAIIYVTTIPFLTCIANTVLFCYTSYKMILIQKATRLATENSSFKTSTMKTRYFIFVKLYLLMDAPWFTSALAAVFPDLWLLKFLRMIQPILMLCAILPPGTMSRGFVTVRSFFKPKRDFQIDQVPPSP
nr:PREDICTED: G-protein coupled receptor Mth2-like [Megachile rotundata]